MVPFKASGIVFECFEEFLLESSGTARLVLVSLFVVEAVKVVVGSKFGIHKNLSQNSFVEFHSVEFRSNLVGRDTGKRGQDAGKQTTEPPGRTLNDMVVLRHVGMGKTSFRPLLNVESNHVHEPGDNVLGGKPSGSTGGKSLAKDTFDTTIPPLSSTAGHGVTHATPHLHGHIDIGASPDAPPLVVGEVGVPQHTNLELEQPQLVLVHVANDNL
mmetsp:Transcript_23467/g.65284  ORF Transcript_23467/g.65284 Transcript_23467/m.65284 type:complete len:214 (+) Transcript_23467:738-1379(+)